MTRSVRLIGTAMAAGVFLASMAAGVQADGYRAPTAAYVAPTSWSGYYGGVSVGGAWGTLNDEWPITDHFFVAGTTFNLDHSNVVEGGHVGVQHQWGLLVGGVELEALYYNDMKERGVSLTSPPCTFGAIGNGTPCGIQDRVQWSGQAVGRVGIAAGSLMPYVKGGIAFADIHTRETQCCLPLGVVTSTFTNPSISIHSDNMQPAGVVGGGVEWAITKNIWLGVDYQHIFIDDGYHSGSCTANGGLICTPVALISNVKVSGDLDMVSARLSYKFDREVAAPVPLK
jgi:outer membrane immunogenic protein